MQYIHPGVPPKFHVAGCKAANVVCKYMGALEIVAHSLDQFRVPGNMVACGMLLLQGPGGGRVAVCEGDSHGFAAMFFKKGEVKVAKFKAGGCLGTSSFIAKNKSSEDSSDALTWPSQMPQVWPPTTPHVPLPLSLCTRTPVQVTQYWSVILHMRAHGTSLKCVCEPPAAFYLCSSHSPSA